MTSISKSLSMITCFRRLLKFKQSTKFETRTMAAETEAISMTTKCSSHFVHVNGIPTKVIKVDGQQGLGNGGIRNCMERHTSNVIFLIIPGNPGIVDFYELFMETLYKASDCQVPVWAVAHAGHIEPPKDLQISGKERMCEAYSLDDQIHHKAAFITEHVPEDKKLILIGHSIGCHIILEVMKANPTLSVLKALQLFPTVERMWASPQGTVIAPLTIYCRWAAVAATYIANYLSDYVKWRLVNWFFKGRKVGIGVTTENLTDRCYMILGVLKKNPNFPILKAILLFPTIERLAETPNTSFYGFPVLSLLYLRWPAMAFLHVATYLPEWLKRFLVNFPFWCKEIPKCAVQGALNLFNPYVANSAIYMAACEMKEVVALDVENIRKHLPQLLFYYGAADGWCPMDYYYDAKELFPDGDIRLCKRGIDHAFVLESSELMADLVWNWMKAEIMSVQYIQ